MYANSWVVALGILFGFVALIALWRANRKELALVRAERARMFDNCLALFEEARTSPDQAGFPALTGRYRGNRVRLTTIVDAVGFRKVPSLWLQLDLETPTGLNAIVDLLVRPQNIEFFSPSSELPETVPLPAGWPAFAVLRADRPDVQAVLEALTPQVVELFGNPKAKEMLITPRGVRIVCQLHQGARAHYLVLRASKFEQLDVEPEVLRALLDRAVSIHSAIAMPGSNTGSNVARAA